MYLSGTSSPILRNCAFIGCSAETAGGGIAATAKSKPVIDNCSFLSNTAASRGAAFVAQDNSQPSISSVLVKCVPTAWTYLLTFILL